MFPEEVRRAGGGQKGTRIPGGNTVLRVFCREKVAGIISAAGGYQHPLITAGPTRSSNCRDLELSSEQVLDYLPWLP